MTLEQAVELGLINSRTYQDIREDLYLQALPVTQQRFSFAYQWAVIENAVRQWAGLESSAGRQINWSLGTTASFSKLFSTGALLTFSVANQTVFNFNSSSPFGFTSVSVINLDLVQPLLQGGGKAVTLEPLTQVERNLVYAIRAFARFREQFYVSVVAIWHHARFDTLAAAATGGNPISTLAATWASPAPTCRAGSSATCPRCIESWTWRPTKNTSANWKRHSSCSRACRKNAARWR